ncbi:hypothetical protein J6590_014497, partial [Homalodisca vitripennis]
PAQGFYRSDIQGHPGIFATGPIRFGSERLNPLVPFSHFLGSRNIHPANLKNLEHF